MADYKFTMKQKAQSGTYDTYYPATTDDQIISPQGRKMIFAMDNVDAAEAYTTLPTLSSPIKSINTYVGNGEPEQEISCSGFSIIWVMKKKSTKSNDSAMCINSSAVVSEDESTLLKLTDTSFVVGGNLNIVGEEFVYFGI